MLYGIVSYCTIVERTMIDVRDEVLCSKHAVGTTCTKLLEGSTDGIRSDFGYLRHRMARHGYALE